MDQQLHKPNRPLENDSQINLLCCTRLPTLKIKILNCRRPRHQKLYSNPREHTYLNAKCVIPAVWFLYKLAASAFCQVHHGNHLKKTSDTTKKLCSAFRVGMILNAVHGGLLT
eukprot:5565319-Amphidinium_carterae.1